MYKLKIQNQKITHFERSPGYIGVKSENGSFYRLHNTNFDHAISLNEKEFSLWENIESAENSYWSDREARDIIINLKDKKVIQEYTRSKTTHEPPVITTTTNEQLGYVDIRVTSKCNFKCSYCCMESAPDKGSFMSAGLFYNLADQLDAMGVQEVYLSGGEPFLHPDIIEFIKRIRERHLISMVTNGSLITDDIASQLASLKIPLLSVSVDGCNEEINAPTRGEGTFEKTLKGIKRLMENGVNFSLICTLNTHNKEQIESYLEFFSKLGVSSISFNYLSHIGRANDALHQFLNEHELAEAKERVTDWTRRSNISVKLQHIDCRYKRSVVQQLEAKEIPPSGYTTMLPCHAGETTLGILPKGDVVPCPAFFTYSLGNANNQSLMDLLIHSEPLLRLRDLRKQPTNTVEFCSSCKYVAKCSGGCRGTAYTVFGDLKAPNPSCPFVAEVMDDLLQVIPD